MFAQSDSSNPISPASRSSSVDSQPQLIDTNASSRNPTLVPEQEGQSSGFSSRLGSTENKMSPEPSTGPCPSEKGSPELEHQLPRFATWH